MRIDIAEEDLALLFCPEQGGWHPGISTKAFGWIRDPLHGTDAHYWLPPVTHDLTDW